MVSELLHGESSGGVDSEEATDHIFCFCGHHFPVGSAEAELSFPDALHDQGGTGLAAVRLERGLAGQHGVLEKKRPFIKH